MDPKKASAENLAVRQEAARRLAVDRDRREAIQQWVLVAVVLAVIVVVVFSQVEATDPGRCCDPLAQAVLLASSDPLAEETKDLPGWQMGQDGTVMVRL